MSRNPPPPEVDLVAWKRLSDYQKNRRLFQWLSDDTRRAELYRMINSDDGVLEFPSRAEVEDDDGITTTAALNDQTRAAKTPSPAGPLHRRTFLLARSDHITRALTRGDEFSNQPYAAIGSGSFMLALDNGDPRRKSQLEAAIAALGLAPHHVNALCTHAADAAAIGVLRSPVFDLASYAEQAALRFASALFGFASGDFPLIEDAMRKAYRALNYVNLGRHFVSEPLTLKDAEVAMGRLLTRASVLIDEYQLDDPELPADLEPKTGELQCFTAVMDALAHNTGSDLDGEERAVLVVGLMSGLVGNIQAAVCIAIEALFKANQRDQARALIGDDAALWELLAEGLCKNPPVAFLPRRTLKEVSIGKKQNIQKGAECVLAIGGATREKGGEQFLFGQGIHTCIGTHLGQPLILAIFKRVLCLHALEQRLDSNDGQPIGLDKLWGFKCKRYPLQHRSDLSHRQQPLIVLMRVRSPTAANAEALRSVIRAGAPTIERVLRQSRHVHFAWFEFMDNDTTLALRTIYDGDFNAYIQHFALAVHELFDRLFQFIEDAPPTPVKDYPNEFVATIRRFNRTPAEGYFFSAYPWLEVHQIVRQLRKDAR